MTRQPTPDDILVDVSQETNIVELVMGQPVATTSHYTSTPIMIRLDWLKDNPYQPRQTYTGIEELAENIRLNGLLQAPVARERQGFYQLAFGHRRLRAYRHLAAQIGNEWRSMPVIVRPLTDEEMARHAWSENHNREDVSAVEEARLFQRDGWCCKFCGAENGKPNPITGSRVVLTVMHLDHDTTNNDPDNLASGCQRCHLRYDAQHHAKNAAATRRTKRIRSGQMTLELE